MTMKSKNKWKDLKKDYSFHQHCLSIHHEDFNKYKHQCFVKLCKESTKKLVGISSDTC